MFGRTLGPSLGRVVTLFFFGFATPQFESSGGCSIKTTERAFVIPNFLCVVSFIISPPGFLFIVHFFSALGSFVWLFVLIRLYLLWNLWRSVEVDTGSWTGIVRQSAN